MKKIYRHILLATFLLSGLLFFGFSQKVQAEEMNVYPVRIFMFYSKTCPHCHDELEFLEKIKNNFSNVEVYSFEAGSDIKSMSLFKNVVNEHGLSGNVPMTIIGEEVWVGFNDEKGIGMEIEEQVVDCSFEPCQSSLDLVLDLNKLNEESKVCVEGSVFEDHKNREKEGCGGHSDDQTDETGKEKNTDSVLLFGNEVGMSEGSSVVGLGILLGLADGINPCMFSVLLFLLTYLLAIGSRKKAFKAGMVFVVTTFILYFLFMLGFIKVIDVLQIATPLRWIVSILAFILGVIMIKDFFYYGKGFSLEISEKYKPTIEKLIKKGTIPSAIILALFSGIVELPCTSGIPLAYITIISQKELNPIGPLLLYNFFFILPTLAIVFAVTFAWTKVDQLEEKRVAFRKWMRLIAGSLLVLLALSLWFNWL